MAFVDLGPLANLPDAAGIAVTFERRRLAVFRCGDEVFVVDDYCPHRGFPLHDGPIAAAQVRCRTHGSVFDLRTGEVLRGPARTGVASYPVEVVDGNVRVELPD